MYYLKRFKPFYRRDTPYPATNQFLENEGIRLTDENKKALASTSINTLQKESNRENNQKDVETKIKDFEAKQKAFEEKQKEYEAMLEYERKQRKEADNKFKEADNKFKEAHLELKEANIKIQSEQHQRIKAEKRLELIKQVVDDPSVLTQSGKSTLQSIDEFFFTFLICFFKKKNIYYLFK